VWSAEKRAEGLEYMRPKPSSHSGRIVASLDRKCLGQKSVLESGMWLRGIFDKETRRKALAVAADALSYGEIPYSRPAWNMVSTAWTSCIPCEGPARKRLENSQNSRHLEFTLLGPLGPQFQRAMRMGRIRRKFGENALRFVQPHKIRNRVRTVCIWVCGLTVQ
jgi:hypothetical protein